MSGFKEHGQILRRGSCRLTRHRPTGQEAYSKAALWLLPADSLPTRKILLRHMSVVWCKASEDTQLRQGGLVGPTVLFGSVLQ